jgi:hypothetical protein
MPDHFDWNPWHAAGVIAVLILAFIAIILGICYVI